MKKQNEKLNNNNLEYIDKYMIILIDNLSLSKFY